MHALQMLNEYTYKTAMGVGSTGQLENGDHPIV